MFHRQDSFSNILVNCLNRIPKVKINDKFMIECLTTYMTTTGWLDRASTIFGECTTSFEFSFSCNHNSVKVTSEYIVGHILDASLFSSHCRDALGPRPTLVFILSSAYRIQNYHSRVPYRFAWSAISQCSSTTCSMNRPSFMRESTLSHTWILRHECFDSQNLERDCFCTNSFLYFRLNDTEKNSILHPQRSNKKDQAWRKT